MLRKVIQDPLIAWDPSTFAPGAELFELSDSLLSELDRHRDLLQESIPLEGVDLANEVFELLARETELARRKMLDNGFGFAFLRGLEPTRYSPTEMENVYWRICNQIGTPIIQKAGYIRFGRVENLGKRPEERPRYHERGTGESVHTDGPIMPRVADYVGLLALRTADEGGQSKFVSIARVHNILLENAAELLEELYKPFFFDRRISPDQVSPRNPVYLHEPIFTYDPSKGDRGLSLRWQPEYVWEATQLGGVPPLSERQQLALHLLEGVLEDRASHITVYTTMRPGDIQLVNNHLVAHDRTPFVDPPSLDNPDMPDPQRRRLLRRVWLQSP